MAAEHGEHIRELVDELNATVIVDPEVVMELGWGREASDGRIQGAVAWVQRSFSFGPIVGIVFLANDPANGPRAYLTALHELGHLAAFRRNGRYYLTHPYPRTRESEAQAWLWALDQRRTPPTKADWTHVAAALRTYDVPKYAQSDTFDRLLRQAERNST